MFIRILRHELNNAFRDKMYAFLFLYPIMMAVVAYFLIPYLKTTGEPLAANIVTLMFILLNSFMFGAITGFTLLDDQDDQVLLSLKISPISVKNYIISKLLISYILGVLATLLIIVVSGFVQEVSFFDLIYILVLTPMQGPIFALLINSFASNKVEGFVMMKLSGIILLVPIAALFLTNWTELFLGILPGFWTARIISMTLLPIDFLLAHSIYYFLLGLLVNVLVGLLIFKLYIKRIQL